MNAIIQKDQFLSQTDQYKHIKKTFFDAMKAISDKVDRTIKEKADSAVYAIKAKVTFSNTDIFQNDLFLAASTESTVALTKSKIRDLNATGKIFQAVSSSIELNEVEIRNISYTRITSADSATSTNFYKISIVNKSTLKLSKCTLSTIWGLLLYVSGSTLTIDQGTSMNSTINDDREAALVAVDTSTVEIDGGMFSNLSSLYFSPILNMQDNKMRVLNSQFEGFDKTLFSLEEGDYIYQNVSISKGHMAWQPGERSFMVNSIVFDASAANLELTHTNVSGIFSNYSSPVVYIENDGADSSTIMLNLTHSTFCNNVATENAGAIYSLNTNVIVNYTRFENNSALLYDAGALYLDC